MRSDITAFLSVVPRSRWPKGGSQGDLVQLPLESYADLQRIPGRVLFDAVTQRAVKAFFANGGVEARMIAVFVDSSRDLLTASIATPGMDSVLECLRGQEDIGLIAMPVLAYLPHMVEPGGKVRCGADAMIRLLLEHCREMNNRFLIIDAPQHLHDRPLRRWAKEMRRKLQGLESYGALYYPWIHSGDEVYPPSGAVAGLYARLENQHAPWGVYWPPANDVLRGVTHTQVELHYGETEELTESGINPIMIQPGRGVVVWGARTLSRDPRWMHINSRRIVCVISEQLRRDSAWAVFENQSHDLWKILERTVRHRMDAMWTKGLLAGSTAGDEYMIQCDEETNPIAVRDAGQVHVKVVMKPISTTEFIVVELRLGANAENAIVTS